MKKIYSLLILTLLGIGSAMAYDFSAVAPNGQTLYYNIVGNSVIVTYPGTSTITSWNDYTRPSGELIIPDTVIYNNQAYPVTGIGPHTFWTCNSITSITIPNSVTNIDTGALADCLFHTSIIVPNSVTSIGLGAFREAKNIVYSGSATGSPWGALSVNGYVDGYLVYQDSTRTALLGCSPAATGTITIPNSVTSIGNNAFAWCDRFTNVSIPNSVTSIGHRGFYGCHNLTSLTIPNSVTSIGRLTFFSCYGLTSVIIDNFVTSIGVGAFQLCTGLTSVTIPNSVTSIGERAFEGCTGLTEITSLASVAPTLGEDAFNGVTSTIPVNIPCGSSSVASYDSLWSYFTNFIESTGFELSAASADETMGAVQVLTAPTCSSPNAVIQAVANSGYHFDHWSDGNTENPRTLVLTSDTNLLAYFAPDGATEGIAEAEVAAYAVRAVAGGVVIEGAAGREVRLYDITGRLLRQLRADRDPLQLEVSHGGVYLLQVDNHAAQRVVVL